ncbi:MAG: four helix bundle protein [Terriglobales bacterium]
MSSDYKELRVWQDAMTLVRDIYRLTRTLPKEETFGLTSQMRRAAVSVPSNIAEGKGRHSQRELAQFLYRARGSLLELETQVLIARDLGYIEESICAGLGRHIKTLACTLNGLINRVQEGIAPGISR